MTAPPPLAEMLAALVAAPSVSCALPALDTPNTAVIDLLAGWLADMGFAVRRQDVPGQPGKQNLIATLGRGEGGLILAGHTDTVPTDPERWRSDPWRLTARDGRWYGLGTTDMKGFFAAALEAARGLSAERLRRPLILLATADEETSMSGARALVAADLAGGRHAVIGEPTGLRPVHQHKGILMEAIRLRGRAGHSSDPSLGRSALEGMHAVMGALLDWRRALQRRHRDPAFAVPVPTLNLGHIHGGDSPNRICGECELHIDLRPLPGMDIDALRAELRRRATEAAEPLGLAVEFEALFAGVPALATPRTAPIVAAAEALTDHPAAAVAFGTEGPFLQRLGIDTLIFGPGDIDRAHQPDEYCRMDAMQQAVAHLRRLIATFCMGD